MTPPVLDADDAAQFDSDVLRVACELELNHRLRARKDKFGIKLSFRKLWTSTVSYVLGVGDDKARERRKYLLKTNAEFKTRVDSYCEDELRKLVQREVQLGKLRNSEANKAEKIQAAFEVEIACVAERVTSAAAAAQRLRKVKIKHCTQTSIELAVADYESTGQVIPYEELTETRGRPTRLPAEVEERIVKMVQAWNRHKHIVDITTLVAWGEVYTRALYGEQWDASELNSLEDCKYTSHNWARRFLQRHEGSFEKAQSRSPDRVNYTKFEIIRDHFDRLARILVDDLQWAEKNANFDEKKYMDVMLTIKPEFLDRIYSLDESHLAACLEGLNQQGATIPEKKTSDEVEKKKSKPEFAANKGGQTISVMACRNAAGDSLPPSFVTKNKRPIKVAQELIPDAQFLYSPTKAFDGDNFLTFLTEHFIPHTKCSKENPVLLMFDGLKAHVTAKALDAMEAHGIMAVMLPPHTTHLLQGEDLITFTKMKSTFKKLALALTRKLNVFRTCSGASAAGMSSQQFWEIVALAVKTSREPEWTTKGWELQGVVPFTRKPLCKHEGWINYAISSADDAASRTSSTTRRTVTLSTETLNSIESQLTLCGLPGAQVLVSSADMEAAAIDGSAKNLGHALVATDRAVRVEKYTPQDIAQMTQAELETFLQDVKCTAKAVMCTTAHHYTSKKRRRNNNGVDYRAGIVSSRQIIDDLHALQHNAAEKQPGAKRSRKKHDEMEAEYRATYTAKEECLRENNGQFVKKLTRQEMYKILKHRKVDFDSTAPAQVLTDLLREHLPEFYDAHRACMARRTRATRSTEDEDAYSSDEDASESDADAVDDVEDDDVEDTPVERIVDDFPLACSRCRWKGGCVRCKEWYSQGRRRIGPKEWSREPIRPPTSVNE